MFPEYRALIRKLKQEDVHFAKVFAEHHELDHKITRLVQSPVTSQLDEINVLKRKKLRLKEKLYDMLKRANATPITS